MSIRVISGTAKGCRLKLVPGTSTRPIMDRVKESLFNILGRDVLDSVFLDLFAGTGSVGIEALSRGATLSVFVETERKAVETIQENLKITRLTDRAIIHRVDVLSFINKAAPPQLFDFIYVAPPQYKNLWLQTLALLDANPAWIPNGTTVIAQIDPSEKQEVVFNHLIEDDQRRYGNTLLWFFSSKIPSQEA